MRISEKDFLASRPEVLATWPTGSEVDLDAGVEYQKSIPAKRQFATQMFLADRDKRVLLQPRAGVALTDEHISLLQYLRM